MPQIYNMRDRAYVPADWMAAQYPALAADLARVESALQSSTD